MPQVNFSLSQLFITIRTRIPSIIGLGFYNGLGLGSISLTDFVDFCHAMVSRHIRKKIVAEKPWAFSYFGFMISVLGNIRIFRTNNSLSRVD